MKTPKLTKDQIQKIILSCIGFIALIYCYFTFFLGPLDHSRQQMTQEIADLQAKTASSKTEMRKTANLEIQAKAATARFDALKAMTEEGAPIAWFPPKLRNFFEHAGVSKATVQLVSTTSFKQPELSDWINDTWSIEAPSADFAAFGKSIAELENDRPLLAVQRMSIHAVPEDPQFQQIALTVQTTLFAR